jgi:hypothetical protein
VLACMQQQRCSLAVEQQASKGSRLTYRQDGRRGAAGIQMVRQHACQQSGRSRHGAAGGGAAHEAESDPRRVLRCFLQSKRSHWWEGSTLCLQLHLTADSGSLPRRYLAKLPPPSQEGLAGATCVTCCWEGTAGPASDWRMPVVDTGRRRIKAVSRSQMLKGKEKQESKVK